MLPDGNPHDCVYNLLPFPLVSWVRCGTWLYRFLIFAPLLTFPMIETGRIAEALLDAISRVDFPTVILSYLGGQLTSDLMKKFCSLISLKQVCTIHYNQKCNGLSERINGVLKSMLKICARRNIRTGTDIYLQFCLHTKTIQKHQQDSNQLNI